MENENEITIGLSEYKYLGLYLDEHWDFSHHENIISKSGTHALGALIAKYKSLDNIVFDTYAKCCDTSISFNLDYGTEMWGYCKAAKIETMQN
jgi:hypothetical protein